MDDKWQPCVSKLLKFYVKRVLCGGGGTVWRAIICVDSLLMFMSFVSINQASVRQGGYIMFFC